MKLVAIFAVSSLFIYQVYGATKICKTSTECGTGECCAVPPLYPIMSRRANQLLPKQKDGHCLQYQPDGWSCAPLNVMNGYSCGCQPGLYCNFYPDTSLLVGKRKRKMSPGRHICESHNITSYVK